jgi:hypothetical protein
MAVSPRAERNREDAEHKSRHNGEVGGRQQLPTPDSFMVWRDER